MVAGNSAASTGVMGEQVVRYVDDSGFEVYADDVDRTAIDRTKELGATSLGSPGEGARRADVSFMLVVR